MIHHAAAAAVWESEDEEVPMEHVSLVRVPCGNISLSRSCLQGCLKLPVTSGGRRQRNGAVVQEVTSGAKGLLKVQRRLRA